MPKGILGKKLGMTQLFDKDGKIYPVTVIEAGPCVVIQKKTTETDGYNAIQMGYGSKRAKLVTKPEKGHFDKANVEPKRYVKEFRVENAEGYEVGQEVNADLFAEGELVDVVGTSKGKGFMGSVQRWNISRGPMSHGSMYHRRPGSNGSVDGARVFKGRHLPGREGNARVTIQGLKIVRVDAERNLILVRGAVPGAKGGYVMLSESVKKKA